MVPRARALPSTPVSVPGDQATVGKPATVSVSVPVTVVLGSPWASCSAADTLSVKLPALDGVIARPFSTPAAICDAEKVMLPPVTVSTLLLLNVAPLGMPPIVTDARLLLSPASPLDAIPRFSVIGCPANPDTASGAMLGASGSTVTASPAAALTLAEPSVACTDREKLASLTGLMDSAA